MLIFLVHTRTHTHTHTHTQSELYTEARQDMAIENLLQALEQQNPIPENATLATQALNISNIWLGSNFSVISNKVDAISLDDTIDRADSFEETRYVWASVFAQLELMIVTTVSNSILSIIRTCTCMYM